VTRLNSLRWRLMVALLLVFGLGFGVSAIFSYGEAYGTLKELRKHTLQGQAQELLAGLQFKADGGVEVTLPKAWKNAYQRLDKSFAYSVYDANRRVVALSPNIAFPLPLVGPAELDRLQILGPERQALLAVGAPEGHTVVVARGHPDQEALAESLIDENFEHLFVVVPFILLSLPLLWQISRWSLRPLARASLEAQSIGPADLSTRLSVQGLPNEVRPLVDAVNGALDRLAHAYEAERRLTADAAHQLRTPITVLDLRLQRARVGDRIDWPTIEREMAQLRDLIDRLMDLARRDNVAQDIDAHAGPQTVNLARVVRESAAIVLPIAEKEDRSVIVEAPDMVPFSGHSDDLRDMVHNLLDNALVHGRGTVRVAVRHESSDRGQEVVIEVADEGMGVPEALKETVFERFRKGPLSQGAGLGLAIVRQVARGHGGDVGFLSEPGCLARVVLPAIQDFEDQTHLHSAAE
jgi:two-component system, OmpR family, sensor histidine kinase TctE